MLTILLVIHIFITIALIAIVLIQHSSSDGSLGLAGGGASTGGSLMSGRASANLLTRTTSILAVAFMANALLMATLTSRGSGNGTSITDEIINDIPAIPIEGTVAPKEVEPTVPIAE